jgi:CheY-like chemotaxis protein
VATIAIIDGSADCGDVLQVLLESEGHEVQCFRSSRDFVAKFKPRSFRLILSELAIPEMDGYELLDFVRRKDPNVPVVAVTAQAYDSDRQHARRAGFSDFIAKPFVDFASLVRTISKYIPGKGVSSRATGNV